MAGVSLVLRLILEEVAMFFWKILRLDDGFAGWFELF